MINIRICIVVMRQYRYNFLTSSPVIFTVTFPKYHVTHQSRNPIPPFVRRTVRDEVKGCERGCKKTYKKRRFLHGKTINTFRKTVQKTPIPWCSFLTLLPFVRHSYPVHFFREKYPFTHLKIYSCMLSFEQISLLSSYPQPSQTPIRLWWHSLHRLRFRSLKGYIHYMSESLALHMSLSGSRFWIKSVKFLRQQFVTC